ncbi:hypothetical protein K438DRAFT_2026313 [Mycena galopus ATCC 62051]|nr:hypothetical protein K438DRAFT_2026313 [Mycena galopus ATCC 62051]
MDGRIARPLLAWHRKLVPTVPFTLDVSSQIPPQFPTLMDPRASNRHALDPTAPFVDWRSDLTAQFPNLMLAVGSHRALPNSMLAVGTHRALFFRPWRSDLTAQFPNLMLAVGSHRALPNSMLAVDPTAPFSFDLGGQISLPSFQTDAGSWIPPHTSKLNVGSRIPPPLSLLARCWRSDPTASFSFAFGGRFTLSVTCALASAFGLAVRLHCDILLFSLPFCTLRPMSFDDTYGTLAHDLVLRAKLSMDLGKLLPYDGPLCDALCKSSMI